jgi:aryl-alcohol dehydrogenase-like predicted oxidoreductase/adenylate kinase family enzyme
VTGLDVPWLDDTELRIGLGCMRLSTDERPDDERALATIAAAVEAGITVFDTARSYGRDETELGHNERLLARALRHAGGAETARIVTKGGMARVAGAWVPDGRARTIRADCEASLEALDGLPIDLFLIHAPDPRTPWQTSLRALARLADDGLVTHVGVANVNRRLLDEALELAPIAAVQVALSPFDDTALRGGVLERCVEAGLACIAHSPLGGPRRAGRVGRIEALVEVAKRRGVSPAGVALAWLLALSPAIVAIPGARRPETARAAAHAARLELDASEREQLDDALGRARPARRLPSAAGSPDVVVVMGIPGAGKTRVAAEYVDRGYVRLNRDERGGSLRGLAGALDEALAAGATQVVLDNTYLTRASRSFVVEIAGRHGGRARCVWLDTPTAQAQVNLVLRLLDRFGSLPSPEELQELSKHEEGLLLPTSQLRAVRAFEPPDTDEGFAAVERVPFTRVPLAGRPGVFLAAAATPHEGWQSALEDPAAPHLVFDWNDDGSEDALAAAASQLDGLGGVVETALCPHGGGPPKCWCRPPLPGLPLAFARTHDVDPSRSLLIGTGPAHRALAAALGSRYVEA